VHRGDPEGFARAQAQRRRMLEMRARVVQEVRGFFAARGFLEVETPILVPAPGQEAHLEPFRTRYRNGRHADRFLVTSPEHHMKRLLGDGFERVFQIGRCFRNGEVSPTHNPEFTMVEWYRAYAACDEVLVDVEELVSQVSRTLRSAPAIPWQGHQVGCRPPWPRISVRQAFAEFAGVDLERCGTAAELVDQARAAGCASVGTQDTWDDAFYKLLLEKVEPALAGLGAAFLTEYPARMAALAKLKEGDPRVAERAEAYVCGIELANGFTELNDPDEQRRRFAAEADRRRSRGGPPLPRDEEFLRAMEEGMPPAGGMALGLDRLVMLMADAPAIDQVLAFPFRV
jgi:lysyl-tRNA synthetase class 2